MIHTFFVHLVQTGAILFVPSTIGIVLLAALNDEVVPQWAWKTYATIVGVTLFSAIVLVWSS